MAEASSKYRAFGVACAQAVTNNIDENAVWRDVVRAHIRLGISNGGRVAAMAKALVSGGLRARQGRDA
jgi:ribosomal protein L18